MHRLGKIAITTCGISTAGLAVAGKVPDEETPEDQEGFDLPVNPDQGTPLIPDEKDVVTVPT